MHLRTHLIVIVVIILSMFLAKQMVGTRPASDPMSATSSAIAPVSPYSIIIHSASWGLNCLDYIKQGTQAQNSSAYVGMKNIDTSKIKENNVLSAVSNICNGKKNCSIPVNSEALGKEPLPACGMKNLEIGYRCFSVDKLRTAISTSEDISIDCEAEMAGSDLN